uniref:Reverse transcriptase Ty1/copia-type domain-containing protein n=1 Tax=Tanacetum cinerariifolium TaxID=118510 RepID=A0A699HDC3_TANCI|nr:hypothetical protein [Tanacetum cinerariifolium]
MEKFLGTVRFGNNDFMVIAGYGDVVIRSMTIKKVCYVEGLGHNLFSIGNEKGVDLLTGDRSLNLYTIALNKIALNSLNCHLAKASSLQSWLWHQCLSHLNFATINNLVKNMTVRVQRVRTDNGTEFKNKTLAKFFDEIHESMNVNFDEISKMASKQFSLEPGLSNLNKTGKSPNPTVLHVEETSKKDLEDLFHNFYDEYFDASKITKLPTPNVETSNTEGEVFHEVSKSFQRESSSSSINDDVQQSSKEVIVPQTNTQSISNDMIPNVNNASLSHNVFNKRLEDAYFDISATFHDTFDVHTLYQPNPHETKWTKDHPFHKIISDPKLSVRTRGQLANSCLFACLLSSIEPANVAEALKDAAWVIAMQDELDQFARSKVWRLVPKPDGQTIIKTKWIFKNKKDESISRIKAIRLFLAYAANKDFTVFQMDVKTAFLNGILKEEVFVAQPPGFVSKQYPDHVYALDKARHGLKQAHRAWTNSTNKANNTAFGVSIAHSQGNTINSTSVDNLSDAVNSAFLASQPNSP